MKSEQVEISMQDVMEVAIQISQFTNCCILNQILQINFVRLAFSVFSSDSLERSAFRVRKQGLELWTFRGRPIFEVARFLRLLQAFRVSCRHLQRPLTELTST